MWGLFHQTRMSSAYRLKWTSFLNVAIGKHPSFFYQHVTDSLFQVLIKKAFSVVTITTASSSMVMSREEENALRYVAGYVIRKVLEQFKTRNNSSEPSEEMLVKHWSSLTSAKAKRSSMSPDRLVHPE